jgi:GNAT superfamily N-acetyltransferase
MYRAVPKNVKESGFRNGDWITPSLEYAKREGVRITGGYRIVSREVAANNAWWDGNSINEFGYDDGSEYAYKNTKNNSKLTDAVTRDRDGKIVPPSERFNSRKSVVVYEDGSAQIERMDVKEGERRQGLGRQLFQAIVNKFPDVESWILSAEDDDAHRFWERLGFQEGGQ